MPEEWDKLMAAAKVVAQTEESLMGNRSSHRSDDRYSRPQEYDSYKRPKRNKGSNWNPPRTNNYDRQAPRDSDSRGERSRYREDARATIDKIGYRKAAKDDNRDRHWTPLSKTPKEVLMTENVDFRPPPQMKNKKGQDPNLYCEFHKDTGHRTDDCISLRVEIE